MPCLRGHPTDHDEWADLRAEGRDQTSLLPCFLLAEGNVRGAGPLHAADGLPHVSDQRQPHAISHAFPEAATALQIPLNPDFNGPKQKGGNPVSNGFLLSGTGPEDELRRHKIPVAQGLPGMGQNLQDHPDHFTSDTSPRRDVVGQNPREAGAADKGRAGPVQDRRGPVCLTNGRGLGIPELRPAPCPPEPATALRRRYRWSASEPHPC